MERLTILFCFFFLSACGPSNEFGKIRQYEDLTIDPVKGQNTTSCGGFCIQEPRGNFLIIRDNSPSTKYEDDVKRGVGNLLKSISSHFNYRIVLAPLNIPEGRSPFDSAKVILSTTSNSCGGSGYSGARSMLIPMDEGGQVLSGFGTSSVGGNIESGLQRVQDIIRNSTGIFHENHKTYVVLISNEDDNSFCTHCGKTFNGETLPAKSRDCRKKYFESILSNLKVKVDRFFTVHIPDVSRQGDRLMSCGSWNYTEARYGSLYKNMSYWIKNKTTTFDSVKRPEHTTPDVYRIQREGDFERVFRDIQVEVTKHPYTYRYWSVESDTNKQLDLAKLSVKSNNSTAAFQNLGECDRPSNIATTEDPLRCPGTPSPSLQNRPTFCYGTASNINLRVSTDPDKDIFSGHVVRMCGNPIKHPECLSVFVPELATCFNYFALSSEAPDRESIILKKNNVVIRECVRAKQDCWELVKEGGKPKFHRSLRVTKKCAGEHSREPPDIKKTGYMLQLYGAAEYGSGDHVKASYEYAGKL